MTSYLEDLSAHTSVGEAFTDLHSQAHELVINIPVLDPQQDEELEEGQVYSHLESWAHPFYEMPVSSRVVRVKTKHGAPRILEAWSLYPEDEPGMVLPAFVAAYDFYGTRRAFELERLQPDGLITIRRSASFDSAPSVKKSKVPTARDHRPTTEIDKMKYQDRLRLERVASSVIGSLATIRCLVSANIAEHQVPATDKEVQLHRARATVADVYELLNAASSK